MHITFCAYRGSCPCTIGNKQYSCITSLSSATHICYRLCIEIHDHALYTFSSYLLPSCAVLRLTPFVLPSPSSVLTALSLSPLTLP